MRDRGVYSLNFGTFSDRRSLVTRRFLAAALIFTLWPSVTSHAQTPTNLPESPTPSAAEERPGNGWNVWENKAFTTTLVLTFGADLAGFVQDDANIEQVSAQPTVAKWRAERINLGGRLKFSNPWVWQVGGNFNGLEAEKGERWSWMDVRLDIPVWDGGRVRIGRQKVGVGMEWELPLVDWTFMERSSTSNAFVPQRNVGVLVTSVFAGQRGTWSAGWFNDWFAKNNSFSGNGDQYSARVTLLPVDAGTNGDALVEVGGAVFYKGATNGNLQYRARPEINQSDYFVDTGNIAGDHSVTSQFETMVFRGPLQIFGEAHMTSVSSGQAGNPFFFGGFAGVAYIVTGEHHGYNRAGAFQTRLAPASPIGGARPGRGAVEVAARYSYVDVTDGVVDGGVMSRWTGAVSWYPHSTVEIPDQLRIYHAGARWHARSFARHLQPHPVEHVNGKKEICAYAHQAMYRHRSRSVRCSLRNHAGGDCGGGRRAAGANRRRPSRSTLSPLGRRRLCADFRISLWPNTAPIFGLMMPSEPLPESVRRTVRKHLVAGHQAVVWRTRIPSLETRRCRAGAV